MTELETLRWTAKEILPRKQADWLTKAVEILREDFNQIGEPFSKITIIVDYPYGGLSLSWLGSYRYTKQTIFINPTVGGLMALDILVHELVHAVVPVTEPAHGERFHEVAAAIGLDDDGPTAGAEEVLLKRLREIQEILGSYPLVFDCLEEA
jgi:hypothetical protein